MTLALARVNRKNLQLHNTHFFKKIDIVKVINTALKSILKLQSLVAKRCKMGKI